MLQIASGSLIGVRWQSFVVMFENQMLFEAFLSLLCRVFVFVCARISFRFKQIQPKQNNSVPGDGACAHSGGMLG